MYRFGHFMIVPHLSENSLRNDWSVRIVDIMDNGNKVVQVAAFSQSTELQVVWLETAYQPKEEVELLVEYVKAHIHDYFEPEDEDDADFKTYKLIAEQYKEALKKLAE